MIPFTLAITFLSLYLGQFTVGLLSKIINMNPVIQYGIKLIFSMIFISIFFVVQGILKISITAFLYGYLITIVSIFNIFLFSTRDLTLFIIFVTEYIIIYLSRRAKRISSVIFYFLLMLLPFLPYAVIIIKNARDSEIMNTVFTGITGGIRNFPLSNHLDAYHGFCECLCRNQRIHPPENNHQGDYFHSLYPCLYLYDDFLHFPFPLQS